MHCFITQFFFFFKQKTAYEIGSGLVGSEMCIRDSSAHMMTDAGAALGGMWRRDAIVEVGAIDEGTRVGKQ